MKFKKLFIVSLLLLTDLCTAFSQSHIYKALTIGDTVNDVPIFKNIINYPARNLSLKDLRGKLVILDFWSTGCPSCVESIPMMEKLQQEFNEKLQIIMIDPWETKENIEKRVSKMKILRPGIGLTTLPNVYGDTIWRKIFPHTGLPHHVWIDKDGRVIATTSAINATPEHVRQVLDEQKIRLSVKNDLKSRGYDVRKKGLVYAGDTSLKPIFYSAFLKRNYGFGGGNQIIVDSANNLYRQIILNQPILEMYKTAFQIPPGEKKRILLEVKNPQVYFWPKDRNSVDAWTTENCFSYEIAVPLSEKDSIYTYMKQDFNRFFSDKKHIEAKMERREYPSYVLSKLNDQIIERNTPAKRDTSIETDSVYKEINMRFALIKDYLLRNLEDLSLPIGFVDETNISDETRVTIDVPKDLKNKENLRSLLHKQGLEISIQPRFINVLVIKELMDNNKN